MKKAMALLALTILTACDYAERRDIRREHDDRQYRAAMDDYRAGRMEAAVAGFEKAARADPANASARFQLACLLQDLKKDYLGAYCGYREFLMQHPESDRAKLAKDRLAICEKEVARILSSKYGLNAAEGSERELETVRRELKAARDRVAAAERNLGVSQERVRALSVERDRLVTIVKGVGADAPADGVDLQGILSEKKALESESEGDVGKSILTEKKLLEEESEDETSTGSSLIPVRKPADVARAGGGKPPEAAKQEAGKPDSGRPKTYVVEEGDTLYGIAKRFYGRVSAWQAIRNANKALISMDNRLRAGDTLVLP